MSVFTSTFRQERTALLAWGLGLFLYLLMIGSSYATIKDNAEFDAIWDEFPEALKAAFGGDLALTSVQGYLESQVGSYLPVLFGVYAVTATTKRLAGAEESGLLDHLLARPVPRLGYFWAVAVAVAVALVVTLVATILGGVLGFALAGVDAADVGRVALSLLDAWPSIAFWWATGLLLGVVFHLRAPALGVGIGLVLGLYALDVVAAVADLTWLGYLTPYGYAGRSDLFNGHPDLLYWTVLPAAAAGLAIVAARRFDAKDLHT